MRTVVEIIEATLGLREAQYPKAYKVCDPATFPQIAQRIAAEVGPHPLKENGDVDVDALIELLYVPIKLFEANLAKQPGH